MQPSQRGNHAQPYFKVLVTGDRHWGDYDLIEDTLREIANDVARADRVMVIHGGATGADSFASRAAVMLGMAVHKYPADWTRYGRAAGPKRNQQMIDDNPDIAVCLVIHDRLEASKGTADCMRRAAKKGIPIHFVNHKGGLRDGGS